MIDGINLNAVSGGDDVRSWGKFCDGEPPEVCGRVLADGAAMRGWAATAGASETGQFCSWLLALADQTHPFTKNGGGRRGNSDFCGCGERQPCASVGHEEGNCRWGECSSGLSGQSDGDDDFDEGATDLDFLQCEGP